MTGEKESQSVIELLLVGGVGEKGEDGIRALRVGLLNQFPNDIVQLVAGTLEVTYYLER